MNQELIERLRARAKTTDHSTGDPLCAEAADALEGGVTVTDEMVRAASMRLITALPNEAVGAIHKADYSLDDIAAAVVRSALSAPAQRVEEGPLVEVLRKTLLEYHQTLVAGAAGDDCVLVDAATSEREINIIVSEIMHAIGPLLIPAPAPHAGVDYKAITDIVFRCRERQKAAGEGDQMLSRWISEELRAALENRT